MSDTSIKPKKPEEAFQPSGLAPFITQGTVATDNLSFMMKDASVIFSAGIYVIEPSPQEPQQGGTTDAQYNDRPVTAPGVADEEVPRYPGYKNSGAE